MRALLAMRQGLTLIDAIMRRVNTGTGMHSSDAWVLVALGLMGNQTCSELAHLMGCTRQQVHRSLRSLEQMKCVETGELLATGVDWRLTAAGVERVRVLERVLNGYEDRLNVAVDLPRLAQMIGRAVTLLVNLSESNGWFRGLCVPRELLVDRLEGACCGCECCRCRCHTRVELRRPEVADGTEPWVVVSLGSER